MEPDTSQLIDALAHQARQPASEERSTAIKNFFQLLEARSTCLAALEALVGLCKDSVLGPAELESCTEAALKTWADVFERAQPFQQETPAQEWLQDVEYEKARLDAEWCLDLLGYCPGQGVDRALRDALILTDPALQLFAVTSLLRRAQPVSQQELLPIAASDEVRILLWNALLERGLQSLMPAEWADPAALAASSLVRWAAHPCELGAVPEEIQTMAKFEIAEDDGPADVYLFRFREYPKPWAPSEGWVAGIAGPFRDGKELDSPWSAFELWDSLAPEEHFSKLYYRVSSCRIK
jgi:hypothetical protein